MKKILTIVLILALVFTLGCANKQAPTPAPADKVIPEPSAPAETIPDTTTGDGTDAVVTGIEAELDAIENLDEDFLSDDLETLDSELDFEI